MNLHDAFTRPIGIANLPMNGMKNASLRLDESLSAPFRLFSRLLGVQSSGNGSRHREKPQSHAPRSNSCLLVGEDGDCVGGVRSTSLLYQIICLEAVLLFGLLTGYSLTRAFPSFNEPVNFAWLAACTASYVTGMFFLIAGITGNVWLFGI